MYCLYIPVLHVYVWIVCIVCIVCICMYLHVLYVLEILYVCVCIVCICLYISKRFFRYIHIHAHTYIHTIHTKYRYVANVCMCMYFRVNTYIIQTAGFTYRQIQTCRFPDASAGAGKPNVHGPGATCSGVVGTSTDAPSRQRESGPGPSAPAPSFPVPRPGLRHSESCAGCRGSARPAGV